MDEFEIELKNEFLTESVELLNEAEGIYLRLEDEKDNPDILDELFRLAHNLKGTSKAVGFDQLAELTHVKENLILKLKENELVADEVVVSALLDCKDLIVEMIEGYKVDFDATFDLDQMIAELTRIVNKEHLNSESYAEVNVEQESSDDLNTDNNPNTEDDELDDDVSDEDLERAFAEQSAEKEEKEDEDPKDTDKVINLDLDALEVEVKKITPKKAPAKKAPAKKAPVKKTEDESIRVKLNRIDHLSNIIGELVIYQTIITQRRFEYITDEITNKSIGYMAKLFKETQELTMSLRMLPIKNSFQKMTRIVRDTAKTLNKKVVLNIIGEETEVDKTVLEGLSDPLVHMIRNAVDHGIEIPTDRLVANKDETGKIDLKAFHEGNNLIIEISDDGKGVDTNIIRKKAIEKNIITEKSTHTDTQILQFLFHPGFSTKEKVTEVSGRGVGMDVVKTNIEDLGGEVNIASELGKGSVFRVSLPLTLAIIDGLVIKLENEKYVVPLNQVFEIANIREKDIEQFSGGVNVAKLRGELLPIFELSTKLGYKKNDSKDKTIIVIKGEDFTFGIVIEEILYQQQIVIKQLGEDIRTNKAFMGSAIMVDGKASFIVDLFALFKEDIKKNKAYQKLVSNVESAA